MIGKNFIFDGFSIPYTAVDARAANWIADIDVFKVNVLNSSRPRQDWHGSISDPTFATARLIPVEGQIFGSKTERGVARKIIEDAFQIEAFPIQDEGFKKLEFTDDDDSEWFLNARTYSRPQYVHGRSEFIAEFFFQMYCKDPLIRSKVLETANGIYGLYGGAPLPIALPEELDGSVNSFTAENFGNFPSPLKFTITGDIVNPKLINLTTGRFWKMNITLDSANNDTLVVDTDLRTAELNSLDSIVNRGDGSNWIYVNSGTNLFLLIGDDFDWDEQSKAAVSLEFHSVRL